MKTYKSINLEFENGKITGYGPSREKPDMETIFPWFQPPQELFDKYGNYCQEVQVTVKEVTDEMGTHTVTECKPVLKPMLPTAEQEQAYKQKRYVEEIRKEYTADDEIALIKDAINSLQVGKEIDVEYTNMELYRQSVKKTVDDEFDEDMGRLAKETK